MLRLRSVSDYDEEVLPAGRHYLPCELGEVLLFIRPGHTVPVAQPAANTAQLDDTALTFWRFAPDGQPAPYRMYTDDGVTTDHNRPEHWRIVCCDTPDTLENYPDSATRDLLRDRKSTRLNSSHRL